MTALPVLLQRLRKLNVGVFLLFIVASLVSQSLADTGAVMVGGIVSLVNFELLLRINSSLLTPGANPGALAAKVLIKFTGLLLLVAALLVALPVNPVAFAVGFSVIFVSIGVGGLLSLFSGPPTDPESTDA